MTGGRDGAGLGAELAFAEKNAGGPDVIDRGETLERKGGADGIGVGGGCERAGRDDAIVGLGSTLAGEAADGAGATGATLTVDDLTTALTGAGVHTAGTPADSGTSSQPESMSSAAALAICTACRELASAPWAIFVQVPGAAAEVAAPSRISVRGGAH